MEAYIDTLKRLEIAFEKWSELYPETEINLFITQKEMQDIYSMGFCMVEPIDNPDIRFVRIAGFKLIPTILKPRQPKQISRLQIDDKIVFI